MRVLALASIASGLALGVLSQTAPPARADEPHVVLVVFDGVIDEVSPQGAAMKAWCDTRNTRLLVVLWPFLQGLGRGRYYPFEKLHGLVEAECQRLEIPFHDVLPALRDTPSEELWVTPADMHANPTAHRLALPGIVNFVR